MPGDPTALNSLLEQLRSAGDVDSDGYFSITQNQAAEKLQRFQLLEPGLYVVHLLAGAVLGQATFFTAETSRSRCEFRFDGTTLDKHQLAGIYEALLATRGVVPGLKELAIGLHAARSLGPRRIVVESGGPEGSYRATIMEDSLEVEGAAVTPGNRVVVEKSFSLKTPLLGGSSELKHLMAVCRYAPLHLTVDNRVVSEPFSLDGSARCAMWRELRPSQQAPALETAPPQKHCRVQQMTWEQPATAVLALATPTTCRRLGLTLVSHGVSFHRSAQQFLGRDGVCGVVVAPHLKKNLSHSDLVENEDFARLRDALRFQIPEMIYQLCEEPSHLRKVQKRMLVPVVHHERARLVKQGDTHRSAVLDHFMAAYELEAGPPPPGGEDRIFELARELESKGDWERAHSLRLGYVTSWLNEIGKFWKAGKPREALDGLAQIRDLSFHLFGGTAVIPMLLQIRACLLAITGTYPGEDLKAALDLLDEPGDKLWCITRWALALRAQGRFEEAWRACVNVLDQSLGEPFLYWSHRHMAELSIALGDNSLAAKHFFAALAVSEDRELYEELAFCQDLFESTPERRADKLAYLRRALPETHDDAHLHHLRLERIADELRGTVPFAEWVGLRARASFTELKALRWTLTRMPIEADVTREIGYQGFSEEMAVSAKMNAIIQAEEKFSPNSEYTRYTRTRVAYQLRKTGYVAKAEWLTATGHLHRHIEGLMAAIQKEGEGVFSDD